MQNTKSLILINYKIKIKNQSYPLNKNHKKKYIYITTRSILLKLEEKKEEEDHK